MPHKSASGAILLMFAPFLLAAFLFLVLVVDFGHFYYEKQRIQHAADAGALAGAISGARGEFFFFTFFRPGPLIELNGISTADPKVNTIGVSLGNYNAARGFLGFSFPLNAVRVNISYTAAPIFGAAYGLNPTIEVESIAFYQRTFNNRGVGLVRPI